MADVRFELKGLENLQTKLKKVSKMEEIERIVEKNGVDMQKRAVNNASRFRGHYEGRGKNKHFVKPTGATNGLFLSIVVRSVDSNIKWHQALVMLLTLN